MKVMEVAKKKKDSFIWPGKGRLFGRCVSSGISFLSELINVLDVHEHVECVPSSRMRKRTHDAEFVHLFCFNKRQRLCHPSSDKAIEIICEGVRELAGPEMSSGD